jgi:hypothetical protein
MRNESEFTKEIPGALASPLCGGKICNECIKKLEERVLEIIHSTGIKKESDKK